MRNGLLAEHIACVNWLGCSFPASEVGVDNEIWLALLEAQSEKGGIVIDGQFISLSELIQCVLRLPVITAKRVLIKAPVSQSALVVYLACIKSNAQVLWVDIDVSCDYFSDFPYEAMFEEVSADSQELADSHAASMNYNGMVLKLGGFGETAINCFPSIGFLTSGSTGNSKIIFQAFSSILAFAREGISRLEIHRGTRCLLRASASWDIFITELFSVLMAGGRSYIFPLYLRNNPVALAPLVERESINFLQLTPSFFDLLVYSTDGEGFIGVSTFVLTGETLFGRHRVTKLFPKARFLTVYGACELHNVLSADITEQLHRDIFISAGERWDVVAELAHIPLGNDYFHLAVQSRTLMSGYSQEGAFFECPSIYHNLDIFQFRDGKYFYCGRLDKSLGLEISIWTHVFKCRANFIADHHLSVVAITVCFMKGQPVFIVSSREEADVVKRSLAEILEGSHFKPTEARVEIVKVVPKTIHGKVDAKRMLSQLN